MKLAALIFCVAAVAGITMLILRIRGRLRPPTVLAVAHGLVALTGFTVLVHEWCTVGLPMYGRVATVIFGLAALGGATLFLGFHVRGCTLPVGLIVAHGLVAASALGTLLVGLALGPPRYVPTVPTPATYEAPANETHKPSQP